MTAKWRFLTAFLALGTVYLGYPYATLYRLDAAVRHADASTLGDMVDWYAVREGLKEDICDMVLDEPADVKSGSTLAPFGSGFVRGITTNVVDRTVTPETVALMAAADGGSSRASAHLEWAFFESPIRFTANVRTDGEAEPIRVTLEFRNLRWQVRRVSLPGAMLERAGAGT